MSALGSRLAAKWRGFVALSSEQRQWFVAAMILLPGLWVALRVLGFQRVLEWVNDPRRIQTTRAVPDEAVLCQLGDAVNQAAHHTPFHVSCLTRSLLLQWFFGRRGIRTELCIGVKSGAEGFAAHAWVCHNGHPVNDKLEKIAEYLPMAGSPKDVFFD